MKNEMWDADRQGTAFYLIWCFNRRGRSSFSAMKAIVTRRECWSLLLTIISMPREREPPLISIHDKSTVSLHRGAASAVKIQFPFFLH